MTAETPGPAVAATGRPGGFWRAALISSLALNMIFIGMAASSMWRHRQHQGNVSGRGAEEFGLHSFLRDLPRERAKELRALIKDDKSDLKPMLEATRAARRAAANTLAAEAFDKDRLLGAFAAIDAAEASVKTAARSAVVAAASHMTADERKQLAQRWRSKRSKFFAGPNAPGHN